MTPKRRFIFWLISVAVACSLGFLAGHKRQASGADPSEPVAVVDNMVVTRGEVDMYYPPFRGQIAAQVILDKLTYRAGTQHKVSVDRKKELTWPKFLRDQTDYMGFGTRLVTELYLSKMIQLEWPEDRLHRVYDLFQDELAQYDVSFLQILRAEDVPALQTDLDADTDFDTLAARYAADEVGVLHRWRRWYSSTELEENFGRKMADTLMKLRPPTSTKPLRIGSDLFIFNLHKVRKSFKELRPFIEQRAFEARRSALLYELLGKAKIEVAGSLGDDVKVLEFRL